MNSIQSELKKFKSGKIQFDFRIAVWLFAALGLASVIIFITLEAVFWFDPHVRFSIWRTGLIAGCFLIVAGAIVAYLISAGSFRRYSDETLAQDIGSLQFTKKDKVLNALQLEKSLTASQPTSSSLTRQFIRQTLEKLKLVNPESVMKKRYPKWQRKLFAVTFVVSCLLSIGFYNDFRQASERWIHPRTHFPVPHPFEIISQSGNQSLMGGGSAEFIFTSTHEKPEQVMLEIIKDDEIASVSLSKSENGNFIHTIEEIFQNLQYRAFVNSEHFWQPWDEISSPVYTVDVIDRPSIEDFTVIIDPPEYTGLSPTIQKGNIAEIQGIKGSEVTVKLKADKPLNEAFLKMANAYSPDSSFTIPMKVQNRKADGTFQLMSDGTFSTHIYDQRRINNLNPIQYHNMVINDIHPHLGVIKPEQYTELGSDFTIPLHLHVEDDYGFSNIQIVYETKSPDYIDSHDVTSIFQISNFSRTETSQDVFSLWIVEDLNLMPEDEIKFHFEVYDNDNVTGPKKSISGIFTARFPSLADLFTRTEGQEEEVLETVEAMIEELDELDDALEAVELELLKDEKLDWENEQVLKEALEKVEENIEEIEALKEALEEITEQAEKHDLFSPELLEKFSSLQDLLSEVITPEMIQAMDDLKEALAELSPEDLLNPIQNFQINTAQLEEQLDRFIEVFERIKAEQMMDEIVKRMEDLLDHQDELVEELSKVDERDNLKTLAEEEKRNLQEFQNIVDEMQTASDVMEPYAAMPSADLLELSESELAHQTESDLESAQSQLQQNDSNQAMQFSRNAHSNMEKMLSKAQSIQQQFQQQTVSEMLAEFNSILTNTLYLSKSQEDLKKYTEDLPNSSPRLREAAAKQNLLQDQLMQLIQSFNELSKKTFAITPEMGKAIGRAKAGMNSTIGELEDRHGRQAGSNQGKTVAALNEAAMATMAAMYAMEQSGSASGFEQFLERMEQMTGMQQGINQQSLQLMLGQMGAQAQQEQLMRRLGQQQEQLRKSLQQMMNEMRGSQQAGSNLDGIGGEMEEVVKDFKRKKINNKTIERQERILSRMLDSQRSMKQRDLSEKRKSYTAEDFRYEGPGGLPEDLGQRRNLAMEALNNSLKSGYPRDYQIMIRHYFNSLMADEQTVEETPDE